MLTNRSAPHARIVPVLTVRDVRAAVAWYGEALGFTEHVRIGEGHRSQLGLRGGAAELIVAEVRPIGCRNFKPWFLGGADGDGGTRVVYRRTRGGAGAAGAAGPGASEKDGAHRRQPRRLRSRHWRPRAPCPSQARRHRALLPTALVAVTAQLAWLGRPLAPASAPATIRAAPRLARRDQQSQGQCTR